jgi:hypothetical protein
MQPRVAVVVPCFNDGSTIIDAVDSVSAQESCELIVVDDGSSEPETIEALEQLESRGVRVEWIENGGSPAARMVGVAETVSRYVFPLDADDCLVPGCLTKLADYLDEHANVAAAWGDLQLFGAKEHLRRKATRLDPWLVTFINDQPAGALVRRDALLDVGGWKAPAPALPNCSWDWNFWLALAEHGYEGHHVGSVAMRYRIGAGGVNSSCLSHQPELYAALRASHEKLFADRSRNRRRSTLPRLAKVAIVAIVRLPRLRIERRKKLVTIVCHIAYRRGGYLRPIRRTLSARRLSWQRV